MKPYWKLTPEEKAERDKLNIFNLNGWKYKNITKELANKYIKEFWLAEIIILIGSLLFFLIQGEILSFTFDAISMVLLIFGIYKRVRWVGVAACFYFFISKLVVFISYPDYVNVITIMMALLFFRIFYLGTLGLFKWHELNKTSI
ncbi:MAG: hypothetical protein WC890_05655 [Candidatus Margulisiibacteriota bacterium]